MSWKPMQSICIGFFVLTPVLLKQLFENQLCGMVEQLREYIDTEGGYRKGIELLKLLGHNPVEWHELAVFANKSFAPRWADARVMALLKGYYEQMNSAAPQVVEHKTTSVKPPIEKIIEPDIIVELKQAAREMGDERRLLHFSLDETENEGLRADKVRRIRELTKKMDVIWTDLNTFEETKKVPLLAGASKTAAQTVDDMYRREKTLRPRISRLNSFLKTNLPLSKKERYERELKEKEAELNLILQKLKGDG